MAIIRQSFKTRKCITLLRGASNLQTAVFILTPDAGIIYVKMSGMICVKCNTHILPINMHILLTPTEYGIM
jgi:hypothetical protein